MLRSAVVCALAAFAGLAEAAIECKDMSGRATDYFVAMKFPRSEGTTTLQKQGMGFAYTDPKAAFADTRESLAGKSHALAATLNQIYNAKSGSGLSFVMYDDEAMDKSSGTLAHAKGVLAYDAAGGFWLVHSTPNWPPVKAYDFPITEADYGQSYLCLTLNKESVKNALTQLKTINPLVYSSANPSSDATLQGIIDRKGYPTAPTLSTLPITTRGGAKFNSIYKNKEWGKELYGDAVAPAYPGNTFYVETWQNGVGFMPDDCAKKVQNVIGVRGSPEVTWKSSEDHSKWAVTPKGSKNKVACIGGINRQASQSRRGGGTVCTSEPTVYNALLGMVNGVENCNGDNILRQNGKDKSM